MDARQLALTIGSEGEASSNVNASPPLALCYVTEGPPFMSEPRHPRTPGRRPRTTEKAAEVHGAPSVTPRPTSCYVLIPSGKPFGYQGGADESAFVFDVIVTPAVREVLGLTPKREDRNGSPGDIVAAIISALEESHIVLADLTGVNPNVYWELGVRHALRSFPVILMMQEPLNLPFDISKERTVIYSPWKPARAQADLKRALRESISMNKGLLSPVHRVRGAIETHATNFAHQFSGKFSNDEWRAIEDAVRVELLIKSGKCRDVQAGRLQKALIECLHATDTSIHVMRVTPDALESFYANWRGDEWTKAQQDWIAGRGRKKGLIRRIAFIDSTEGRLGALAWRRCLQKMDSLCDLRVCLSDSIQIAADRHFASWDFGVFRGKSESHTIFTFASILRGVVYAKHTGGEFHTTAADIAEHFARPFELIWEREGFLEQSERVKAALRDAARRKE